MQSVAALLKLAGSISAAGPVAPLQAQASLDFTFNTPFASGTGIGQADMIWTSTGTLTAGSYATITLSALTDAFGQALVFARVKGIAIINNGTAGAATLQIGGTNQNFALTSPATAIIPVNAASWYAQADGGAIGIPVVVSTGDQLVLKNSGTLTLTYNVYLQGASV